MVHPKEVIPWWVISILDIGPDACNNSSEEVEISCRRNKLMNAMIAKMDRKGQRVHTTLHAMLCTTEREREGEL